MVGVIELGAGPGRSSHNQSVVKAIALMRCFVDAPGGLTLSELARRTGTNVSTTHRLLQSLTLGGVLRREAGSDHYRPGNVLLALAGATFTGAGYEQALAVIRSVADETGESASLGILDGDCVVVILTAESTQALRVSHVAGERIPANASAMAKVIMAGNGRAIDAQVAALGELRALTSRTIAAPGALVRAIEDVRRQGWAVSSEEQYLGARSIAVPIAPPGGATRAALAVHGPTTRLTKTRLEAIREVLQDAADVIALLPFLNHLSP